MEITIPANKATLQIISSVYDQLVESGASIKIVLENVSPEALASMRPFVTVKGAKIEPVIPPPTTTTCPICRKRVVFFIDQDFVAPTSCPHCNAPVEPFAGDVEDLEDHLKVILGDQCTVKSSKKTVTGYNSDGILACAVRVSKDTWLVFTQTRAIALNEKDISKIVSGKVLAKRGITVRFVPTPGMPAPEVKPVSKFGKSSAHVSLSGRWRGYNAVVVPLLKARGRKKDKEEETVPETVEVSLQLVHSKTAEVAAKRAAKAGITGTKATPALPEVIEDEPPAQTPQLLAKAEGKVYVVVYPEEVGDRLRKMLSKPREITVIPEKGKFMLYVDGERFCQVDVYLPPHATG